jgi:HlyD family secretion protein
MSKGFFVGSAMVITATSIPFWMTGRGDTSRRAGTPSLSVSKAEAPRGREAIRGLGFIEPATEIRKLVFKVDGVISHCTAEVGRSYRKGDVLMELDDREKLAAIVVAEAERKVARSERERVLAGINPHQIEAAARKVEVLDEQVRYLQREHERERSLLGRNTISPAEYDRAFTEWSLRRTEQRQAEADLRHLRHHVRDEDRALAEAGVVAAEAKLDLARQCHEDTILRAPFDGVVLELLKREGEGSRLFDPEPVAICGALSRLRVRAEIDERFVAGLGTGQGVSVFGRD